MAAEWTHEALRKRAVKWLTNTKGCSVVLSEIVSAAWETPDAVGWKSGHSILVECKVSRSDFFAQRDKPHVRSGRGVGRERFIMCPKGLLSAEDLTGTDYGLLAVDSEAGVRCLREPLGRESCLGDEVAMLASALRRVKAREFIVLIPGGETQCP